MAQKLKLETLTSKVEYMIMALGGRPDRDVEQNEYLINQFEEEATNLKEGLSEIKDKLKERVETIDQRSYQSNERIILDEDINR